MGITTSLVRIYHILVTEFNQIHLQRKAELAQRRRTAVLVREATIAQRVVVVQQLPGVVTVLAR